MVAQAASTVRVNGTIVASGTPSQPIVLSQRTNTISISVTQGSLASKGYNLTVIRLSSDANLSNLTLSGTSLSPSFSPGQTDYTASVPFTRADSAAHARRRSRIRCLDPGQWNDRELGRGQRSDRFEPGAKRDPAVVVTSQDGTNTNTYQIVVTKQVDTQLSGLSIGSGTLTPSFNPLNQTYAARVHLPLPQFPLRRCLPLTVGRSRSTGHRSVLEAPPP